MKAKIVVCEAGMLERRGVPASSCTHPSTKVLKLVDFGVVTFLGTGAFCLLKQVIDSLQSWCICINRSQDRKGEVLSVEVRE